MAPFKSYKSLEDKSHLLRQVDLLETADLRQASQVLNVSISCLSRILKERKRIASLAKIKHRKVSKIAKCDIKESDVVDAVSSKHRDNCEGDKDGIEPPELLTVDAITEIVKTDCADDVIEPPGSYENWKSVLDRRVDEAYGSRSHPKQDEEPCKPDGSDEQERLVEDVGFTDKPTRRDITSALSVIRRALETDLRRPLWYEFVLGRLPPEAEVPRPTVRGGPWGWEVAEAVGTIHNALQVSDGSSMWVKFALNSLLRGHDGASQRLGL